MSLGFMSSPALPQQIRVGPPVRTSEILRVTAILRPTDYSEAVTGARGQVLAWAESRAGARLPQQAHAGKSFEHTVGGRTILGAQFAKEGTELWALQADDPDKTVPGRVWTTEVVLGYEGSGRARISLRLTASSTEHEIAVGPAVPALLHHICAVTGLLQDGRQLTERPWSVTDAEQLGQLIDLLEDPIRQLPVVVASGDDHFSDDCVASIDLDRLARASLGLAHVAFLPGRLTYGLSSAISKKRSVFHGGVRLYLSGFDSAADPFTHPLFLGEVVRRDPRAATGELRHRVASESIRRTQLGRDVVPFAAVRSVARRLEQEALVARGASTDAQLTAAQRRINAVQDELDESKKQMQAALELAVQDEQRANDAEHQLRSARARIQLLEERLKDRGQNIDENLVLPAKWEDLPDWCERELIGRLVLAPAARRGIKSPDFDDVETAAACLLWLASTCRDRRMNGGGALVE